MAQGDGLDIIGPARAVVNKIEQEARARSYRASNALRNGVLQVLRGQRSGRRYRVPYTYSRGGKTYRGKRTYQASAPGEPPAVLTGGLRVSFWPRPRAEKQGRQLRVFPAIASELKRAKWLDEGTKDGRIKPRPYSDRVKAKALPEIRRIYSQKFL